jgi:hypothetical protein
MFEVKKRVKPEASSNLNRAKQAQRLKGVKPEPDNL